MFEDAMLKKMDLLLTQNQKMDKRMEEQEKKTSTLEVGLRNLETTIGQIAQVTNRRTPILTK